MPRAEKRTAAMSDNVSRIVQLESDADKLESEADGLRWEAARLIVVELDTGKSQRKLASEIGKSQSHVRLCAAVWREYLGIHPDDRPRWNDAYQAAKSPKPVPDPDGVELEPLADHTETRLNALLDEGKEVARIRKANGGKMRVPGGSGFGPDAVTFGSLWVRVSQGLWISSLYRWGLREDNGADHERADIWQWAIDHGHAEPLLIGAQVADSFRIPFLQLHEPCYADEIDGGIELPHGYKVTRWT